MRTKKIVYREGRKTTYDDYYGFHRHQTTNRLSITINLSISRSLAQQSEKESGSVWRMARLNSSHSTAAAPEWTTEIFLFGRRMRSVKLC
ncbi:unnamed protein product [Caenorhabditis brenneri]